MGGNVYCFVHVDDRRSPHCLFDFSGLYTAEHVEQLRDPLQAFEDRGMVHFFLEGRLFLL